ncbi:SpoIIE family protein phosphatase [Streptomyces sp. NPDC002306]
MSSSVAAAFTAAQTDGEAAGIGAVIALLDADARVVGWTQDAERLLGYAPADVVGHSAVPLLADDAARATASPYLAPGAAPALWSGFAKVRHRAGHTTDVHLCVQSVSGRNGRAQWVVSATGRRTSPAAETDGAAPRSLPGALRLPEHLPIGVVIRDTELRCTWANDAQGVKDGVPLAQRLGQRLSEAVPGTEAETLETLMRQVLRSGVPILNVEYQSLVPGRARKERTLTASLFRLDDGEGRALGVCLVSVDVTASRRARERLAILGDAGKRIGTTLDVTQTGQELADLAVPLLADYATVDLAESVLLGNEPLSGLSLRGGRTPAFRRAGLASVHQGIQSSLAVRGERVVVPPKSPFYGVLRSGRSHFEPILNTSPGTWVEQHTATRAAIHAYGAHSLMVVPIHARGAVLGMALFARTHDRAPFEEDDLLLAEEVVSWAALSLDNARQYARERLAALALQRHLLPHHATGGSAADVASRYLPADSHHGVGGDWFDVIQLSGARIALVVGDVVGHGINAAATMGQLRAAVRTLAAMDVPPDELLARLDEQVVRLCEADADAEDPAGAVMAATCLYAVYDPVTRCCTMARAGHPPPAIVAPDGAVTFPPLPAGAPLGLGLGVVPFESVTVRLPEHTTLAFYSDGLIEGRDHDIDVGMDRLAAALAQPGLPLDELSASVVDTLAAGAPGDDVTLLLARTRALGPDQVASWRLPATPAVVHDARALATGQLSRWGLDHLAASTELIVSELVTNAIRHSDGTIGLRLIRHEALTCEVHDTSNSHPCPRRPRVTDENGRGLLLVKQLSRRWGTRNTSGGKLIWAEQRLTPGL